MKSKIRIFALAVCLLFLLSGCSLLEGDKNDAKESQNKSESSVSSEPSSNSMAVSAPVESEDSDQNSPILIGVVQLFDQPSYNMIRDSMLERLEDWGYDAAQIEINVQGAGGSLGNLKNICQSFVANNASLIVAIGPDAVHAANLAAKGSDIPVIFSGVEDPQTELGMESLTAPTGNLTGVSTKISPAAVLDLARQSSAGLKTMGILYNAEDSLSAASLEAIRYFCNENGIALQERSVGESTAALSAFIDLCDTGVSAVLIPFDHTASAVMADIIEASFDYDTPVYSCESAWVENGALGAVSADYVKAGQSTADLVVSALEGRACADMPVVTCEPDRISVNNSSLETFGFTFSEDLMRRAIFYSPEAETSVEGADAAADSETDAETDTETYTETETYAETDTEAAA